MKKSFIIFCMIMGMGFTCEAWACRFWAVIGEKIPQAIVYEQLISDENSLKNLGARNKNGWGIGYYQGAKAFVYRGKKSADVDSQFNKKVEEISRLETNIIVSHIRQAASGCRDVVNPHPFIIEKNGKTWVFGHNGVIEKKLLIDLIGEEYLRLNPPSVCTDNPPSSWVDTELYFIYLLKNIEDNQGDVVLGLKKGLVTLEEKIGGRGGSLNFFLSDGETLWAFRKNNSLAYAYDDFLKIAIVCSTAPNKKQKNWQDFPQDVIGVFSLNKAPRFEPIRKLP